MIGSPRPSTVAMDRTAALHIGLRLVRQFESALYSAGYSGPVSLVGGYLRDVALRRDPRDLDLFIDGGRLGGMHTARAFAMGLARKIGPGATVLAGIPSYGGWAEDVKFIIPVAIDKECPGFRWFDPEAPIPSSVDLVVLDRAALQAHTGWTPRLVNDSFNQELFLEATLKRVDLRINALGAAPPTTVRHNTEWDQDAYYRRLVVQYSRKDEAKRINHRLAKLQASKYKGWDVYDEQADGSLLQQPLQPKPAEPDCTSSSLYSGPPRGYHY